MKVEFEDRPLALFGVTLEGRVPRRAMSEHVAGFDVAASAILRQAGLSFECTLVTFSVYVF